MINLFETIVKVVGISITADCRWLCEYNSLSFQMMAFCLVMWTSPYLYFTGFDKVQVLHFTLIRSLCLITGNYRNK